MRQLLAADESLMGSAFNDTMVLTQLPSGQLQLTDAGGLQSTVVFDQPTNSLTIDANLGIDRITVQGTIDLGSASLHLVAEEIYVAANADLDAGNITFDARGLEEGLSIANNLPIDLTDFLEGARTINVGDGATIDGQDISLSATRVSSLVNTKRPFGIGDKNVSIVIGDAHLQGDNVSIVANAADENLLDELPGWAQHNLVGPVQEYISNGILPNVPFAVMIRSGEATIDLTSTQIDASGNVRIDANTVTDATTSAVAVQDTDENNGKFETLKDSTNSISVGYSQASSVSRTTLSAGTEITAAGDVDIVSGAETVAKVTATTDANTGDEDVSDGRNPAKTNAAAMSIAVSHANTEAITTLDSTVVIHSDGNVNVHAVGDATNAASAGVQIFVDGSGGLGIAIGDDDTTITSTVDGTIVAKGTATNLDLDVSSAHQILPNKIRIDDHGLTTGDELVYRASDLSTNTETAIGGLAHGGTYRVVVVDSDHIELQRDGVEAIELDARRVRPAATHTLQRSEAIEFDAESGAVNLLSNTITVPTNKMVDGSVVRYRVGANDEEVTPADTIMPIGGLEDDHEYVVIVLSTSGSTSTIQLAEKSTPGLAIDLTAGAIGDGHVIGFEEATINIAPASDVDRTTNQITISPQPHGLNTGDQITYATEDGHETTESLVRRIFLGHQDALPFDPTATDEESGDTVDLDDDLIQLDNASGLVTGQRLRYRTGGGSAIGGLSHDTDYFAIVNETGLIGLANSQANALAGNAIDLQAGATGTNHEFTPTVVEVGDNEILLLDHGYETGQRVRYFAGDGSASVGLTDSTGLDSSIPYFYAIRLDSGRFQLASSRADALAGTARTLSGSFQGNDGESFETDRFVTLFDSSRTEATVSGTELRISDHGLIEGTTIVYRAGGGEAIDGLDINETYIVHVVDSDTVELREVGSATSIALTAPAEMGIGLHALEVIRGDVDFESDLFFLSDHDLNTGDKVVYRKSATPSDLVIDGLVDGRTYEAIRVNGDELQLREVGTTQVIDLGTDALADAVHTLDVLSGEDESQVLRTLSFTPEVLAPGGDLYQVTFNPTSQPTVDAADNSLRIPAHGFVQDEEVVYLTSSGQGIATTSGPVTRLAGGTTYMIDVVDEDHIRLKDGSGVVNLEAEGLNDRDGLERASTITRGDQPIRGLANQGRYFVRAVDANTIELFESRLHALSGGPIALDFSSATGSGHFFETGRASGIGIDARLKAKNEVVSGSQIGDAPKFRDVATKGQFQNRSKIGNRSNLATKESSQGSATLSSSSEDVLRGTGGKINNFISAAGALAYSVINHDVLAEAGAMSELSAGISPSDASVNSDADISVTASINQDLKLKSQGTIISDGGGKATDDENVDPKKSKPRANKRDKDKAFAAGVAVSIGDVNNNVQAVLRSSGGNHAVLNATGEVTVHSSLTYPLLVEPITLIPFYEIGNAIADSDAREEFLNGDIREYIQDSMGPDLGIGEIVNVWASSQASGEGTVANDQNNNVSGAARLSVAASIAKVDYVNVSKAIVGEDVRINQDAAYQTVNQAVTVDAAMDMTLVNVAGVFTLYADPKFVKDAIKAGSAKDAFSAVGNRAGVLGLGGSILLQSISNQTIALVSDGAMIRTAASMPLTINADEKMFSFDFVQAGGESGKVGISGSVSIVDQDNETIAQLDENVTVVGGGLSILANDDTSRIAVVGAVQSAGIAAVGASVGLQNINRETLALIGSETDAIAGGGLSINVTGDIDVTANSSGSVFTIGLAGSKVSKNKSREAKPESASSSQANSASSRTSGIALAGDVTINELTSNVMASIVASGTIDATGDLDLIAHDATDVVSSSGAISIASTSAYGAALAGSFAKNDLDFNTKTKIAFADVDANDVTLLSTADNSILAISAGITGTKTNNSKGGTVAGGAIAGSFSWNVIDGTTLALVAGANITSANDVVLSAIDTAEILAISAGVAVTLARTSRGTAVGIAAAGTGMINDIDRNTSAQIADGSVVIADGDVNVTAENQTKIRAYAVGASLAVGASATGTGVGFAVGVSLAENHIAGTTEALVMNSEVQAGSDVLVSATASGGAGDTISQTGADGVNAAMLDDATQEDSDDESTAGTNEYDVDRASDLDVKRKLFRQVTGTSGNTDHTLTISQLATETVESTNQIDGQPENVSAQVGRSWLLSDETAGKSYVITDSNGQLTVRESAISALSVAAAIAVASGKSGVALSGGGASTKNEVLSTVNAAITDSTIVTDVGVDKSVDAGHLKVLATNSMEIVSTVIAAAASLAFSGGSGGSLAIGVSIAKNTIGVHGGNGDQGATIASIDNSVIHVDGNAEVQAIGNQQISTTVIAASVAVSGSTNAAIGLSGAGASVVNEISADTRASITNIAAPTDQTDHQFLADDVSVTARDNSAISATAGAAALAATVGGGPGVAIAIGVGLAENTIDSQTLATIENAVFEKLDTHSYVFSDEEIETGVIDPGPFDFRDHAVGNVDVSATSVGSIDAFAFAASLAAGFGSTGVAIAGAGAEATNRIETQTNARIDQSRLLASGDVDLDASNDADIDADVLSLAVALAGGSTGVGAAIGVSLARNIIGSGRDGAVTPTPTGVGEFLTTSSDPALTTINLGDRIQIAAGPGAGDIYEYLGGTQLPNSLQQSDSTWLTRLDFNDAELWKQVDLAKTTATTYAIIEDSSIVSGGDLTADAVASGQIESFVIAAAVAISGGGSTGVGLAGSGVGVKNDIKMDVAANIEGEQAEPATPAYRGPDGQVVRIVAGRLEDPLGSFAGDSYPAFHNRSIGLAASDNSTIDSTAGAASIAAAFGGSAGIAAAIGVSLANNSISNQVDATIDGVSRGLFTTGSSDVVTTIVDDQGDLIVGSVDGLTLGVDYFFEHAISEVHQGDLTLSAVENATIDSWSAAASVALGFGGSGGLALSGAGATATNVINNQVHATISNSVASSFAHLAEGSELHPIGGGDVATVIVSLDVTPADVVVSAHNESEIKSTVAAIAAAISGGTVAGAGAIGVALAENHIGTAGSLSGSNSHGTYASIVDSTVSSAGLLDVDAVSDEQVKTLSAAGSVAIAVGIGGAGAGSGATSDAGISGDTHAWIHDSDIIAADDLSVDATSTSKVIEAEAIGASLAVSVGAVSIAVTLIENTLENDVQAWIDGTDNHSVMVFGDLNITADAADMDINDVTGTTASVSAGVNSFSGGGLAIDNRIENNVAAKITGGVHVMVDQAVTVHANEKATVDADSFVLSAAASLGAAIGVAIVENHITSTIDAAIDSSMIIADSVAILADSESTIEKTQAVGIAASLVGIQANEATAVIDTKVDARADNADIDATGQLTITANSTNHARSKANGGAFGAIAVGVMEATLRHGQRTDGSNNPVPEVLAQIGDSSRIVAGGISISANSNDDLLVETIAAGGGVVAAAASSSNLTSDQTTLSRVGDNAWIRAGSLSMSSNNSQYGDSTADAYSIALGTGAGAGTNNEFTGDADVEIGAGADVIAGSLIIGANNEVHKNGIGDGVNLQSGSVGGINVTTLLSRTDIGTSGNKVEADVNVGQGATIEVNGGTVANPGIIEIEASVTGEAFDKTRLEAIGGYAATFAQSVIESETAANVNLTGASLINRRGDIDIATFSDIGLFPSSNLFAAGAGVAAGADANADANLDNTITVSDSLIRGGEVRLQSGRSNFQVPNLVSLFSNVEVTTASLSPSLAIGVPNADVTSVNRVSIQDQSDVEGFQDVILLAERNNEIPIRAETDGLVLSLSLVPYGYDVGSNTSVTQTADVSVAGDTTPKSSVTAGIYNKSVLAIRSIYADQQRLIELANPQPDPEGNTADPFVYTFDTDGADSRLATTDPDLIGTNADNGLFQAADYEFAEHLGLTLDDDVQYHFAPLNLDAVSLSVSTGTIVKALDGFKAGGNNNTFYRYLPDTIEDHEIVLETQDYSNGSVWQQLTAAQAAQVDAYLADPDGYVLPSNSPIDPTENGVYTSREGADLRSNLTNQFYVIKNPDIVSPTLSYKNVGNLLFGQRNQVLEWMASHANNPEAIARYQVQLDQIDRTLAALNLTEVVSTTRNGVTFQEVIVRRELDAVFLELPDVFAAPGSVFIESLTNSQAGDLAARAGSSITISNNTPFIPVVGDTIVRDNRRVVVIDDTLTQLDPGHVYVNWVRQGSSGTGDGFGTGTISIVNDNITGAQANLNSVPTTAPQDLYITGDVINENGSVLISNVDGSIHVSGQVRGASVTVNAGRDFNLNSEDWLHTNRDPRQYINYQPLRAKVFRKAGNTVRRSFATTSDVSIPQYRTVWVRQMVGWLRFGYIPVQVPIPNANLNLQDQIDTDLSQITAQGDISITARYLNVNGLIQSGVDTVTLNVDANFRQDATTTSLLRADGQPLSGISFTTNVGDVSVPVNGYFDAAKQAIVVNDITPTGGRITIAGQLFSTGNGRLVAAHGHASVAIANNSPYRLLLNEIDTTEYRVGEIILVDTSTLTKTIYESVGDNIRETHYVGSLVVPPPAAPIDGQAEDGLAQLSRVVYTPFHGTTAASTQNHGTTAQYFPGVTDQTVADGSIVSQDLQYGWVEGQDKTRVTVEKFEKRSFNLFGDNAFGDFLVRDGSFKWETVNFRDSQPLLESEFLFSPSSPNSEGQIPTYAFGTGYTIQYSQELDGSVDIDPGDIVQVLSNVPSNRKNSNADFYRYLPNAPGEFVLGDQDYTVASVWDPITRGSAGEPTPNSKGIYPSNVVSSTFVNQSQAVRRWSTGGGWLRKKTRHTEVTTITGLTDYYTHTLKANVPITIDFVGGSPVTDINVYSVGDIVLQGDITLPINDGSSAMLNTVSFVSGGDVQGADTIGFYGVSPTFSTGGDLNVNVETNRGPLQITSGGTVRVDGITNQLVPSVQNNQSYNDQSASNDVGASFASVEPVSSTASSGLIVIDRIDAAGDVFITAELGILAMDPADRDNSPGFGGEWHVRGDKIELRTRSGAIGDVDRHLIINSNRLDEIDQDSSTPGVQSTHEGGGLSALAVDGIFITEETNTLILSSPEYYSPFVGEDSALGLIAVRSTNGDIELHTLNGDIVDGISETFSAPTADELTTLNEDLRIIGLDALEAAENAIINEEVGRTSRYHRYWAEFRNANATTSTAISIDQIANEIQFGSDLGLSIGDTVVFRSVEDATDIGLTSGDVYFVVASGSSDQIGFSLTSGGSKVDLSFTGSVDASDYQIVRAVENDLAISSVDSATDRITTSVPHGLTTGDEVTFDVGFVITDESLTVNWQDHSISHTQDTSSTQLVNLNTNQYVQSASGAVFEFIGTNETNTDLSTETFSDTSRFTQLNLRADARDLNFTDRVVVQPNQWIITSNGSLKQFTGNAAQAVGLQSGTTYYAVVIDSTTLQLAISRKEAAIIPTHRDPSVPLDQVAGNLTGDVIDLTASINNQQQMRLLQYHYTFDDAISAENLELTAAEIGTSYDPNRVFLVPETNPIGVDSPADRETRREERVSTAGQLASPISGPLRRFLYPQTELIGPAASNTGGELLNISGGSITLQVGDTDSSVEPPSGRVGALSDIQTFNLERGLGLPIQEVGESNAEFDARITEWTLTKEFLSRTDVDDVLGRHYVTYRFMGVSGSLPNAESHDFAALDGSSNPLWVRVDPDVIATEAPGSQTIAHGENILVEYDGESYGWYEFIGVPVGQSETMVYSSQNFADTLRWTPINNSATAGGTLQNGQLVHDTTTLMRVTVQIVDDVNVETTDSGMLDVLADGDVAIHGTGNLKINLIETTGAVRVASTGDLIDLNTGEAAIIALGNVGLNGQVVRSSQLAPDNSLLPLRVLVGPAAELSGSSAGDFRVVQGGDVISRGDINQDFGDLTVSRAYSGNVIDIDVTDGDLTIGKLESVSGIVLTATGSLFDGSPADDPTDWNVFTPTLTTQIGGSIGTVANPIDFKVTDRWNGTATGDVFVRSERDLRIGNANFGGSTVNIEVVGDLNLVQLDASAATTTLQTTGDVLNGRVAVVDDSVVGQSHILTRSLVIDATLLSNSGSSIGTPANPILIDTSRGADGTLTASADLSIWLSELVGDLRIDRIESDAEDVSLTAQNSLIDANDDSLANVLGRSISLTAGLGDGNEGSIGSVSNDLDIDTGSTYTVAADTTASPLTANERLSAIATGAIYLTETAAAVAVGTLESTLAGDVRLTLPDSGAVGEDLLIDSSSRVVVTDGSLLLFVGDDMRVARNAIIAASDEIQIEVDPGSMDVGVGSVVDIHQDFDAPIVRILGGADEDAVWMKNLSAGRYYVDMRGGTDRIDLELDQAGTERVSVTDTGNPDDGADTLTVHGTSDADTFLLRQYFLALLQTDMDGNRTGDYERVDYDETINGRLRINSWAGADRFYIDDNATATTIDGGAGQDVFQIGQVFGADPNPVNEATDHDSNPATPDQYVSGVVLGDEIATTSITRGYLSRGISEPMVIYGGLGSDTFTVYSNKATLRMEGEAGNDTFLVRAFIIEAEAIVEGGDGDDVVEYNINAPVSINGGEGHDRVVAVGSEADDSFVITPNGIFGAGLNIVVDGVEESIEIDGLEGNDSFFLLGTASDVIYTIIGGLGSDLISIGGDVTQDIISGSTDGRSSVINHGAESVADPAYDNTSINGVGVTIAGATDAGTAGIVTITQSDGFTAIIEDVAAVFDAGKTAAQNDADNALIGSYDTYQLAMAVDRTLYTGTTVYLTVSAAGASKTKGDENNPAESVEVSIDGGVTWLPHVVLVFDASSDGTWSDPRDVRVRGISDNVAEGELLATINHSIIAETTSVDQDVIDRTADLQDIPVSDLRATLYDDDQGGLIIRQSDDKTEVLEGAAGFTDTYTVQLTSQPTHDVTVTLSHDGQLSTTTPTLTFTNANWNIPQLVTVTAVDDTDPEDFSSRSITHSFDSVDPAFKSSVSEVEPTVEVTVLDNDTAGAFIVESDGSTTVNRNDGSTDSYTLRLTKAPTGPVSLPVYTDGQTLISVDGGTTFFGKDNPPSLTFTTSDWMNPKTVIVKADPSFVASAGQPTRTFTSSPHQTSLFQGPIVVRGGVSGESRDLVVAVMLPTESPAAPDPLNDFTNEAVQTDTLLVFNDASSAEASITPESALTVTPTNLSGINMGTSDISYTDDFGSLITIPAGINYYDLEVVEVMLGSGNDIINVNGTDPGAITVIHGGGNTEVSPGVMGGDTFNVNAGGVDGDLDIELDVDAPLILLGDTFQNGFRYTGLTGQGSGNALSFDDFGNDIFNITSTSGVTAYGGLGDDIIAGGSGDDLLLGGGGQDTITGNAGHDRIFGDSGLNADLSTRMNLAPAILSIVNVPAVLTAQQKIDFSTTADFATNYDSITGNDDDLFGNEGNDLIFGDHGSITMAALTAADDNGTPELDDDTPERLALMLLTSRAVVTAQSEATDIGGSDQITGDDGNDRIFGGFGTDYINFDRAQTPLTPESGADILVGDNGRLTFFHDGGVATGDGFGILQIAETIAWEDGSSDFITAGTGRKIILGGAGSDHLLAGADNEADLILGDEGVANFDPVTGILATVATTTPDQGGDDIITAGNASNVLIGGAGGDNITGGNARDVVLGDNGQATFDSAGELILIVTTDTAIGGNDIVNSGAGNDVVLGGAADDTIHGGAGLDTLLGDNGSIDYTLDGDLSTLDQIITIDPTIGGIDTIEGESDNDILIGGTAGDSLIGGTGHDILLGDHGEVDFRRAVDKRVISRFTGVSHGGGDDTIEGNDGDDFAFGGQGNDIINGGLGQDDLVGGHNVPFGSDGDDTIDGGADEDVILGDNGILTRELLSTELGTWTTYLAPFDSIVVRDVQPFDDRDLISGDDNLSGSAGMDIIRGQRGDDTIHGGDADDELIGGLGEDTINGDAGQDFILGDAGQILRDFNSDGTPQLNSDGTWHRDLLTERIARVTEIVPLDPAGLIDLPADVATRLLAADQVLLASIRLPSGEFQLDATGQLQSVALLLDLVDANADTVDGGAGNDIVL
ncbi:MAG: hypothetical protein AB8B91_04360, partial [Rubripirellula sp.]